MCKRLTGMDGCFACASKNHKMRDIPNIKEKDNEVNQVPLDPNSLKKNPPYGMGARRENKSGFDSPYKS